jgi:acetyl-CoA carboxylase/biotin carboxylase 1
VRKAEPFHGSFPVLGPPTAISGKVHQKCAASLNAARMILAGYEHNIDEVSTFLPFSHHDLESLNNILNP